jgi:nuclear RNA export factor
MVAEFSRQSGMTISYSERCLIDNGNDFDKAAVKFGEIKAQGILPADAWLPGRAP